VAETSEAVQGFVLSAFANLLSNKQIQAYFAVCRPHSKCALMPLSDLIQQVPRLLELLPSECLAALIATSTTHRSQIHDYVTSITISDPTHTGDLISCSWPRLLKWTLANQDSHRIQTIRVTCDMAVAAASVLAKASMRGRWQLQLECTQLSEAAAAEIAKGDWPFLIGLSFWHTKLTRAFVQELVAANWPALTLLSFVDVPVDMGLLSLLSQARWPKLAFLNLFKVRLRFHEGKEQQMQHLSAVSNAFSRMVSQEDTRQNSSRSSALLHWASIILLNLTRQQIDTQMISKLSNFGVNQIQLHVFSCTQLDAAVILQLTKSECPSLQSATVYNDLGNWAMSYLAQGKWPLLNVLDLHGSELEDTSLDELFRGESPLLEKLKLTVTSLHEKANTKWQGLSSDGVQEALRQPEQDLQVSELKSTSVPAMMTCNHHCTTLAFCTLALPL